MLDAYGWPDLAPTATDALLDRLVALNAERAAKKPPATSAGSAPTSRTRLLRFNPAKTGKNGFARKTAVDRGQPPGQTPRKTPLARPRCPNKSAPSPTSFTPTPLDEPALAARFTGKGPWKKRLPEILAMLAALGRAKQSDGGWVG